MIEGAAILFVGFVLGGGVCGWGAWHAALVAGRNRIEKARSSERVALDSVEELRAEVTKAHEQVRAIERATLAEAVEGGLIKAPKAAKRERSDMCTCGDAKSFHKMKLINGQERWFQCTNWDSDKGMNCRCQGFVEQR